MRFGKTRRDGRVGISRIGRVAFINTLLAVLFVSALPAWAAITGPSSASVVAGNSVSVNIGTTEASVFLNNPGYAGISASPTSGPGPTVRFSFVVGTNTAPGNYAYNFTDGQNALSFTLAVTGAPPTTTTTAEPPPPPPTTPPTTRAPTPPDTEAPEEIPTTVPPPPTTLAPTTTRAPTTTTSTTTTLPPTTTTSTLIPAGIVALDNGDTFSSIPIAWRGGGLALLTLAIVGALIYFKRRPAYGSAAPGFVIAWRHRTEKRRAAALSRPSRSAGIGSWWRTSGPLASYRVSRDGRRAKRDIQRKIKERRRLGGN